MSYEKLLNDLETLQKSYAADEDDKKIQAAANAGNGQDGENEEEDELDADGKPTGKKISKKKKDGGDTTGDPFAKSFTGKTAEGEDFEAIDGTEMMKALHAKLEALAASTEAEKAEKADLAKSLEFLVSVVKTQGALIKSLQTNLDVIGNQGRGTKSQTTVTPELAKSLEAAQPLTKESFMLKANAAFDAGRISGKELNLTAVSLRDNYEISQAIVNKILGE